jgi:hypothetical protein
MLRRLLVSASYLSLAILSPCPRSLAQKATSPPTPVIGELQIYEQTKKTLQFFEQDTLQRQKLIAGKLVGRACDPTQGTCDKSGRVTQEVVELAFHGSLVGVRGELEVVESAHQARSKRNASTRCADECRIFYEAAVDGAKSYWPGQSWLGIAMNVLFVSAETVNDKQEAAREKFKEEQGKKENLTSEQSDAELKKFDLEQGQKRKEVFSKIAPEFRNYVLRLSEDRMKLIQQLWHMYDLAEENHDKENADLVKRALQEWDKGTLELSGQLYFGFYVEANGEPKDEWCKKRTEPDIEPADSQAPCSTLLTDLMRQRSVDSLRPPKESIAADTSVNCTELRLSYAVANVYVGEDSPPAILSFLPEGCAPTDEFIGFDWKGSHVQVQVDLSSGVVTGKAPGRASIRAYQGTWDKPRLEASTTIDVLRGPCTGLALSYEPQEIELGRIAKHKLVYTPNFCHKPDGDVEYSVSPKGALDMDFPGDFKGIRSGNAIVTATQGSSGSEQTLRADSSILVMGGSDCKAVSLSYQRNDEEWTFHPNLVYDTITCVPPKPIVYRSSDPQIAAVDKTTGMVKGLAGGKVTISLDEGPPEGPRLHAEAEIEVPRWPKCESYSLKFKTLTVPVGSRFKMPLPDSYPRFSRTGCQRGQMDITVDQPNVVNVEDPLIIRAVGKGKATITLHIDKWEDSFTVEVK